EKGSSFITDMHYCSTLVEPVARLIDPLRELILSMDGCREIPQIEVAVGEIHAANDMDSTLQVALILRHLQALSEEDLQRLRDFADNWQILWYLQAAGPDSVCRFWPEGSEETLRYFLPDAKLATAGNGESAERTEELRDTEAGTAGSARYTDNAQSLELHFGPGDFTQVNAAVNRQMILQALDLLDLQAEDTVLDLFCGLGNFTLPMALRCAQVTGVEGSEEMVRRATDNARRN